MKRVILLVTISILAIGSLAFVTADRFSALRLKAPKSCIEACGQRPESGDYEAQVDYQMCIADCHPKIDFLHQNTDDLQAQIDALEARVEALEQQPSQCTEGEARRCYTGPPGTEGVGECTAGSQTCQEGEWGPCSGEILPTTEICDGLDNDCNLVTNDGTDETWLGDLCDGPDADFCIEGTYECVAGVQTCSDETGNDFEICGDGLDNNCDGSTDEGCACTEGEIRSCYTGPPGTEGVGECTAGSQTCQEGEWGPCSGEILPSTEICGDGMDNNCDGSTDEGC